MMVEQPQPGLENDNYDMEVPPPREEHVDNAKDEYEGYLADESTSSPGRKYQKNDRDTDVTVTSLDQRKASDIHRFASLARPYMRSFHASRLGLFLGFYHWFVAAPLQEAQWDWSFMSKAWTASTLLALLAASLPLVPLLCNKFGPRIIMAVTLALAATTTAMHSFFDNQTGWLAWRCWSGWMAGSSFAVASYWINRLFTQPALGNVYQSHHAWATMGAATGQLVTGLCSAAGFSWLVSGVLPAILTLAFSVTIYLQTDDSPKGNFKVLREHGATALDLPSWNSFSIAAQRVETWSLFFNYAHCFGMELLLYNFLGSYFTAEFGQSISFSAFLASLFAITNLVRLQFGCSACANCCSCLAREKVCLCLQPLLLLTATVLLAMFKGEYAFAPAVLISVVLFVVIYAAKVCTFSLLTTIATNDNPESAIAESMAAIVSIGGIFGAFTISLSSFYGPPLSSLASVVVMLVIALVSSVVMCCCRCCSTPSSAMGQVPTLVSDESGDEEDAFGDMDDHDDSPGAIEVGSFREGVL